MALQGLVIAGCLSGERGSASTETLVSELALTIGADVTLRARTGGRPVGPTVIEALAGLRSRGVGHSLVVTTHLANGRLHRACARDVARAAPGFDELRLAPPLLAAERDYAVVAAALDAALPERPGRVIALAGHRGAECEAALATLERALLDLGRGDVILGAPAPLAERLARRPERRVLLGPLLMALGHHARHDVLSSLRAELVRAGADVTVWPHALVELIAVRALIVDHARRELP